VRLRSNFGAVETQQQQARQHDVVRAVMGACGGYATLGYLYQTVVRTPQWQSESKTPFASIRRIVQDGRFFFKIRPGLWGLKEQQDAISRQLALSPFVAPEKVEEYDHAYYQGLLVELGNLRRYATCIDYHDKNRLFLSKRLSEVATLGKCYPFTYDHLLRKARTVDVSWFNPRQLPHAFFEVEHTTGIYNSLLKFWDFQDFRIQFYIVADAARKQEFQGKLQSAVFDPIRDNLKFLDYETVARQHSLAFELAASEQI